MKSNISPDLNTKHLLGDKIPKTIRFKEIYQHIRRNTYPTTSELANELNVNKRTITRDISDMKELFGLPIEYDSIYRGYYFSSIVDELPYFEGIKEDQILAFVIALKSLSEYRGTPFHSDLNRIFNQLVQMVDNNLRSRRDQASNIVSFINNGHKGYNEQNFMRLIQAGLNKQSLIIKYRNLKQKKKSIKVTLVIFSARMEGGML